MALAGLAGTAEIWEVLGPFLPHCTIVRFDYRLTGDSQAADGPVSPARSAADAAAILDHLGLGEVAVFGISAGGMAALELAVVRPDLVGRLALGCTTAGGESWWDRLRTDDDLWDFLVGIARLGTEPSQAYDLLLPLMIPPDQLGPETKELFLSQLAARRHPPTASWAVLRHIQGQMNPGYDMTPYLASIGVPTLIQHGTQDRIVPFREGKQLAAKLPDATLEPLDGAGHVYWLGDPVGIFGRVAAFTRGSE